MYNLIFNKHINRSAFRRYLSFIFVLLFNIIQIFGQDARVKIRSLSIEDGLSSHNISCVTQDEIGYLWVGTDDGLHRYDGVNFQVYRNDPGDSLSISDTRVSTLLATSVNRVPELWIGTRNGLNHLNLQTGVFTNYFHIPDNPTSLSNAIVTSLAIDDNGALWVGTENGLNLLPLENREAGSFLRFLHADQTEGSNGNFIRRIIPGPAVGPQRQLWVGTRDGLKSISYFENGDCKVSDYDFGTRKLTANNNDIRALFIENLNSGAFLYVGTEAGELFRLNIFQLETEPQKLWKFKSFIRDILIDEYERIWVATYGGGLFGLSMQGDQLTETTSFEGHPELKNSLSNSHLSDIDMDMSGILWVATDNGLNAVLEPVHGFSVFTHKPGEPKSLSGAGIRSIYEDSFGLLWVGTVANGLTRINRKTGEYKYFIHDPERPQSLSTNSITTILEDNIGALWFGTWEGGLLRLNSDGETFTQYQHDTANPQSIAHNIVQGLIEDRQGRIWINTGNGLSRYDRPTNSFINYVHDPDNPESISSGDLQSKAIYLDPNNRLWLGSYGGGLNSLDLKQPENLNPLTARFKHFRHSAENDQSISSDLVISLAGSQFQDKDILWVGTFNAGLTRMELEMDGTLEKYTYKHFTESDGLSDDVIFGIEEDRRHDLWLSTGEGLSRLAPESEHFTNYYVEDGLPANGFFWGASYQSATGELFFGGTDGLIHFYPDGILGRQLVPPKISITNVKLMNKSFSDRPRDYNGTVLKFDYSQNLLTIDWALFDFINPVKNHYEYRLDGLQDEWVSAGNKTSATFTNLPGGSYTFIARGTNYNGAMVRQNAQLSFHVKPPFWQTLIFRIALFFVFVISVYVLVRMRTKMIADRNKNLHETNEALNVLIKEREAAEEITRHSLEEKEVLLREIYHRTKNNMSVIISMLNLQAVTIEEPEVVEMFDDIKGRIYAMSLVHEQLMRTQDLSVIDLDGYVRQLVNNLLRGYRLVGSRITTRISINSVKVSIDTAVPLGLVINEIITNSLKYAFPDERRGEISINAHFKDDQLLLKIADNGVGFVPKKRTDKKKSLGTRIIHSVVKDQLGGELLIKSDAGTSYEILLRDIEIIRRV